MDFVRELLNSDLLTINKVADDTYTLIFHDPESDKRLTIRADTSKYPYKFKHATFIISEIVLAKYLNKTPPTDSDELLNLLLNTTEAVPQLRSYCACCLTSLEVPSDHFSTCGSNQCVYDSEELPMGDFVIDFVNKNLDTADLLLKTGIIAAKSRRREDIFEPFPIRFLKDNGKGKERLVRGQLSAAKKKTTIIGIVADVAQNIIYDKPIKDFNLIDSTLKDHTPEDLIKEIKKYSSDQKLKENFGIELYSLIRFMLMSNKTTLLQINHFEEIVSNTHINRDTTLSRIKQ